MLLQNNIELVDVLLSGNANPLIETPTGATAFSLAGGRKRVAATIAEACVLYSIEYNNMSALLEAIANGNTVADDDTDDAIHVNSIE